jgi:hypothetical protein
MKLLALIWIVWILARASLQAQPTLYFPTNPPTVIQVAWNYSTSPVSNFLYYGDRSGAYTNKSAVGLTNLVSVTLPAFGTKYFFAVTSQFSNTLESVFSNESTYTTPALPDAPVQLPPVILTVQYKDAIDDPFWSESAMYWALEPEAANRVYRLKITGVGP